MATFQFRDTAQAARFRDAAHEKFGIRVVVRRKNPGEVSFDPDSMQGAWPKLAQFASEFVNSRKENEQTNQPDESLG